MSEEKIDLATRLVINKLVLEDITESQQHRQHGALANPESKPDVDNFGHQRGPETAARMSKAMTDNLELGNRNLKELYDVEMALRASREEYDGDSANSFGADGISGMEEATRESRAEFERELHQRLYGREATTNFE